MTMMIKNIATSSLYIVYLHTCTLNGNAPMTCTSNARPPDPHALLTPLTPTTSKTPTVYGNATANDDPLAVPSGTFTVNSSKGRPG